MAELRLIVACALAACGRAAEAVPATALQPPAGWQAMPALDAAIAHSLDGVSLDGHQAWGEPAMGCYAAWLSAHGGAGEIDALGKQLLDGLAAEKITTRDVVQPAGGADRGIVAVAFERAPYHGRLRAIVTRAGALDAIACFWNDREPAACDAACTPFLGELK